MLPFCLILSLDAAYVIGLQRGLKNHGVKLHGVADAAALTPILAQWRFDAVLCDAAGSHRAALDDAIRLLRREQRAPIVVLASPGSEDGLIALKLQRLIDLAAGAGDVEPRAVALGELRLDPRRAQAVFADRPLPLTGGEFELLFLLAARADGFVHRDTIMRTIGRARTSGESRRCADMHVCRIRRKLREAGASSLEVETVYGRGYALRLREGTASALRSPT